MMIPNSTIITFVVAAMFTVILPIVMLIALGIRKKISGIPLLVGTAAFFLSQVALRLPLINILSTQSWMQNLAVMFYPYILLLSFSAGLFEESARLGGAFLLKRRRSYKDIISFGLGHGICEVIILVGLSHVNNIILCFAINGGNQAFMATLSPDTLEMVMIQFTTLNPINAFWGILERFSAVLFHIFATVLVFQGVIKKKWYYYVFAIIAHTLFNLIASVLFHLLGVSMIWIVEIVLLILAMAAGLYVLKSKNSFTQIETSGELGPM